MKISALTALTGTDAADSDVIPIVDVSAGTSGTKKMTMAELRIAIGIITKTDTGDPAGREGLIVINTFDNTLKMYADGAWRSLTTSW
jgi:hypothetical protein